MVRKLTPKTLLERETQILDLAHDILLTEGPAFVTMERIAELVPFSKGTLYNHFKSREDVLMALFCRIQAGVHAIFSKGASYPGSSRDRYAAIIAASEVRSWSESDCCPQIIAPEVLEKASPEYHQRLTELHHKILGLLSSIATDAIEAGELPRDTPLEELIYGTWALAVGADELHRQKMIYPELTEETFAPIRRGMLHRMLDGYQWQPLSLERDYESIHQKVLSTVFAEEWAERKDQLKDEN
ncbi:MAG: TetR/AcrR family transcriptional regulator [Opitutales bacterium]|nr:TetR/AcrR family transcriptional regulator [Opitutales bacterium]